MTVAEPTQVIRPKEAARAKLVRRVLTWAIALGAVMSAYVTLRFPLGIEGEWLTQYHVDKVAPWAVVVFAASLVAFLGMSWVADGLAQRVGRAGRALIVAVLATVFLLTLYNAVNCGPYGRAEFAAPVFMSNGIGLIAAEAERVDDPRTYLASFPARLREYASDYSKTVRVNNNPPGMTMLFYAALRIARSGSPLVIAAEEAVFGGGFQPPNVAHGARVLGAWFAIAGAALAFVPAYLIAGSLSGGPSPFATSVALCAGSIFLFNPGNDNFNLLPLLLTAWLALKGLKGRPLLYGVLAGIIAAAAFFFTLATAVVVAVLGVASLLSLRHSAIRARDFLIFWGMAALGLLAGFAILRLALGYNSVASLIACYRNHALFYTHFPRTYWLWVPYNMAEFAIFLGGPLVACVLVAVTIRKEHGEHSGNPTFRHAFVLAAAAVLVVLDLSGKNLSEVNRLWTFMMPLMTLPACAIIVDIAGRSPLLIASLLQGVYLLILRAPLDVWRSKDLIAEIAKYTGH